MSVSNISSTTVGWVAIITGSSTIMAVIFLALMYSVKRYFGFVNDIFNSLIGISSAVLAGMLYAQFHMQAPSLNQILVAVAVIGAVFTIVGTILSVARFTDFVMAGWFTGIGNALIGLWLVNFCYSMLNTGVLPHNLLVFGILTGAFMAVGLIGILGVVAKIDKMESIPWYLKVAFLSYLGTYLLYPIWAIWLGRHLLLT